MKLTTLFVCSTLTALLIGCSSGGRPPGKAEPEASAAQAGATVSASITPEAAKRVGIEVLIAGPQRIRSSIALYGSMRPNAEREQEVRARYAGVVSTVNRRIGDKVASGEVLFTVESSESLQVYPVRSPLAGQVLARSVNPGDAVDTSTVLMRVADLSTVWAEFVVFARDLRTIRPGMEVSFRAADSQEGSMAKLTYVAPAGRADSQSVVARAVADNRSGRWVAGQFVTGEVITEDKEVPVAVHAAALQELNDKTVVFVQAAKGFEPREVSVGRRSSDYVEISSGLEAGSSYAAKNSYLIKADLLKGESEEE